MRNFSKICSCPLQLGMKVNTYHNDRPHPSYRVAPGSSESGHSAIKFFVCRLSARFCCDDPILIHVCSPLQRKMYFNENTPAILCYERTQYVEN